MSYKQCDDCKAWYEDDDTEFTEIDDLNICEFCMENPKYDTYEEAGQRAQDQRNDCAMEERLIERGE